MLDKELERFRLEAIRQLENEQQKRDAQLTELQEAIVKLEATNSLLPHQILRAKHPLPAGAICPRCWVWDGEKIEIGSVNSSTNDDLFRCKHCGTEIEVRIG